uniref:hypothetical protein n=1 Tax=Blautia faecicola TaxID=2509240 RepID=UPI003521AC7C
MKSKVVYKTDAEKGGTGRAEQARRTQTRRTQARRTQTRRTQARRTQARRTQRKTERAGEARDVGRATLS